LKFIILHEDCDPTLADDKNLPTNSYLVEYILDAKTHYDIVMANKKVDIFDHYYDLYRKDLITFNQTEGRISPKLYGYEPKVSQKKEKK
jgi:hypothetical protein